VALILESHFIVDSIRAIYTRKKSRLRVSNITRRCSGQLDSRAERGNAHNPRDCQIAGELGVM